MTNKHHWDQVYATKKSSELSWTQAVPQTSLSFIRGFHIPRNASIIDIGGGDSTLVDHLLQEGYTDLTVLDISAEAIEKAKTRLGNLAGKVHWIVSDIIEFKPERTYDVWHDRATFHFLTTPEDIQVYLAVARNATGKFMTIGTFSKNGPDKCSGLPVRQYDEGQLEAELRNGFSKMKCITEDHITPFHSKQNFLFCSFRKAA
jgi:SAM-dependent methyltransferase